MGAMRSAEAVLVSKMTAILVILVIFSYGSVVSRRLLVCGLDCILLYLQFVVLNAPLGDNGAGGGDM